jgi:hypothetical protein
MTAAEHIAQAEQLLADSIDINDRNPRSQTQAARAQVHATLALCLITQAANA